MSKIKLVFLILCIAKSVDGQDYFKEGELAYANNDFENSIELFEKSLKNEHRNCESYKFIGANHIMLDQMGDAIISLKSSLKCDSTDYMSNVYLARALGYSQRFLEAIYYYDKAITLNPSFIKSYEEIALCKIEINDYEDAKQYLFKAMQQDSLNAELLGILGTCYIYSRDFDQARKVFEAAIRIDTNGRNLASLGEAYDLLGNYNIAEELYLQSVEYEDCSKDVVYFALGVIYMRSSMKDKACEYFRMSANMGYKDALLEVNYCDK